MRRSAVTDRHGECCATECSSTRIESSPEVTAESKACRDRLTRRAHEVSCTLLPIVNGGRSVSAVEFPGLIDVPWHLRLRQPDDEPKPSGRVGP